MNSNDFFNNIEQIITEINKEYYEQFKKDWEIKDLKLKIKLLEKRLKNESEKK